MNDLFLKIKAILTSVVDPEVSISSITINDELKNLGIDSFKFVKMLTLIEVEFEIEFDENELIVNNFRRIEDLLRTIQRKCVSMDFNA